MEYEEDKIYMGTDRSVVFEVKFLCKGKNFSIGKFNDGNEDCLCVRWDDDL